MSVPREAKHELKFGKVNFNVDKRYTPISVVGTGAYGVVCKARDKRDNTLVAIKKIPRAFEIMTIAKRTLLEVKLLKHFNQCDNVVTLLNILRPPPTPEPFNDVYVVMDLLESDLHRIIHSKQKLSEEHRRYFMYQLCRGLKFIHSANVLHRDIKPSNLLVNSTCHLKICDFGMARRMGTTPEEHSGYMTAYVATRWYRAPEVLLVFKEYTKAIDSWSVGCIFGEMLGRKYLFAGTNYVDQLNLILNFLGTPTPELIEQIGSLKAQQYLRALNPRGALPLHRLYPHASLESIELLGRLLLFDPQQRVSMEDALAHPFFARYHKPEDEPTCDPFDFEFEKKDFPTAAELKRSILKEIESYHPKGHFAFAKKELATPNTSDGGGDGVGATGGGGAAQPLSAVSHDQMRSGATRPVSDDAKAQMRKRQRTANGTSITQPSQIASPYMTLPQYPLLCGGVSIGMANVPVVDGGGGSGSVLSLADSSSLPSVADFGSAPIIPSVPLPTGTSGIGLAGVTSPVESEEVEPPLDSAREIQAIANELADEGVSGSVDWMSQLIEMEEQEGAPFTFD